MECNSQVCPTEIIAFNDRAEEFLDLNTQLIAGSTDTEEVDVCQSVPLLSKFSSVSSTNASSSMPTLARELMHE